MQLKNVYRVKIDGGSHFHESYSFGSGGGINYICDALDTAEPRCELDLRDTRIRKNTAQKSGGGINWPQVKPRGILNPKLVEAELESADNLSRNVTVVGNQAGVYGDNFASYAVKIVRLVTVLDEVTQEPIAGQAKAEIFADYSTHDKSAARRAIGTGNYESYPHSFSKGTNFRIPSVQSGGFIPQQYLALLDEYDQICANIIGSYL